MEILAIRKDAKYAFRQVGQRVIFTRRYRVRESNGMLLDKH